MTLDRAELTGASAALVFHVALIAALSMSLASVASPPEPPAMEVELVEEVGLQSAAPRPISPPPPSQAPEIGAAEPTALVPTIQPSPAPGIDPAPARTQPRAPRREAPRVSRIGDDFLKGIAEAGNAGGGPRLRFPGCSACGDFCLPALGGIDLRRRNRPDARRWRRQRRRGVRLGVPDLRGS